MYLEGTGTLPLKNPCKRTPAHRQGPQHSRSSTLTLPRGPIIITAQDILHKGGFWASHPLSTLQRCSRRIRLQINIPLSSIDAVKVITTIGQVFPRCTVELPHGPAIRRAARKAATAFHITVKHNSLAQLAFPKIHSFATLGGAHD